MHRKPQSIAYAMSTVLLPFSLILCSIPFAFGQEQQRERRVVPPANQTPAPTPITTPGQGPVPLASPTPSVAPPRTASTTRTTAELRARIADVLNRPELTQAIVGIKVVSLETGRVLFEENSHKLLRPASSMKIYTVAAALDRLSPDYRFVTSVYAREKPDQDGVVKGDLIIYGRGDPSLSFRFNNGDYLKGFKDLADRIVAAGVKRVKGDLVGDESYFTGTPYGSGWAWEDLQWWYGAEVSSLTVNDNFINLSVKPGARVGAPAVVTLTPPNPLLTISNRVNTGPKGFPQELTVYRELTSDVVELTGSMPFDSVGYSGRLAISRPAMLFSYLLRSALAERGVTIAGKTRTVSARTGGSIVPPPVMNFVTPSSTPSPQVTEIARMESVPLSTIVAQTLKPSQNLYAELILRTLGTVVPPKSPSPNSVATSESAGLEVVKTFLKEAGVNPLPLSLTDGSGLSRNDMITPEATVQLLTYMHRHARAMAFRDALPIAGVDGTLRSRMKGTQAENNLRAKTGTLSSASSLSGYVTSASGEELVFSIIVNNYPEDIDPPSVCIDPIAVLLASFAGRS